MADTTLIIAGLGNPGREYERTRHNAGFLALDALLAHFGTAASQEKWEAQLGRSRSKDQSGNPLDLVFVRPLTFMNLSGKSVCPAVRFYKVAPARLLVLHDEVDIPFGDLRVKKGGGHAGHNGLRDIIDRCGSRDFHRLRIGVGRPQSADGPGPGVADHVLARFSTAEEAELTGILDRAVKMTLDWVAAGG